ncbi:hypothetical protein BCR34DRAFT_559141 [Clohesyomyces aquaticus]|uniref:VASt domain-containing protein n=1 Tax=Clohesyomyces aquaticus TaxID=1231657 RepID=A0A1Y1ZY39_9PLEO|nr:hypothetical protein BCR34DRAFT_559141 [Clohesyomyces aquaticus]
MEAQRASSTASSTTGPTGLQHSLHAPYSRQTSKGGSISSAHSIASSDSPGERTSGLQSSGDGALDKFKRRSSEDGQHSEGSSTHRRRMSKLFKGRRRRSKASNQQDDMSQHDGTDEVPPLPDAKPPSMDPQFHSEESLGLHKSVASSLLTEDSDAETSRVPVRPGISPHQSHAGYLTLSSPLIASETIDSAGADSSTLVDAAASVDSSRDLRHANTLDVAANIKRSPSPVGKLREAFAPTRRSTSPKTGANTDSARPTTSGGGLGALFGGKKASSSRSAKVLDDSVPLQASPPSIHDGEDVQSTQSLPPSAPKRIITQIPATPPNLVEAPTTLVTPPTPTDAKPPSPTESAASSKSGAKHGPSPSNPNIVTSPSGNMISHRRARSATNPPSKLSNSISAPLTPTIEEIKTPGGTAQSPSGFFSSVFSAAQNAANTLSTTIANTTTNNKNKNSSQPQNGEEKKTGDAGGEEVIGPDNADNTTEDPGTVKRRPAVETIGSGNLSLAQLGISDSTDISPMSSAVTLPVQSDQASAKAEDLAAAQAVSAAYADEKPTVTNNDRPRSLTTQSGGATSPPRITDSPSAIQRQGSIRSRISGGRKRRHRGSSATTGNTIAAAIGASTSTLAPQAAFNGQRLNGTGFAVASPKRNRDFHNLFKSVPEDDYLIEDYSAALQKEILLHGRLYVSEGHLCFSSNILGWVTNLVISFDEVVSVEKKSTAVVFPNAIVIQTLHARNIFASFLSRDSTYDLIIGIWKISHPNLKSSLNGVALDGFGTGDKTEKAESVGSEDGSIQDSDDEVYDEDAEEEEGMGSFTEMGEGSVVGSETGSVTAETGRKVSAAVTQAVSGGASKASDGAEAAVNGTASSQDFPGVPSHSPTDCGDSDQHYDKLLIDTTIPAPLGKIYSLMWGPASGAFMRKWLIEDQKSSDLQLEDDKKGLGEDRKTLTYSYIKPLGGSIGPKQTKCNISATLEQFDLDKAVTVLCSTGTPDVPSGSMFLTKTRYCLMWGPGNTTRLIMTFTVEWSGKSWLKGPIEKGANDGQLTYATSIASALRAAVSTKAIKAPIGKPGKGKRRQKTTGIPDESAIALPTTGAADTAAKAKANTWGILEPLRSLLGPVADIIDSLVSTNVVMGVLVVLLVWSLFFRSTGPAISHGQLSLSTAQRVAAYEEIWRNEENELWDWIEERVAMDRVRGVAGVRRGGGGEAWGGLHGVQAVQEQLGQGKKGMKERQMDEAIRVTEERLQALKEAVKRGRGGERTESKMEE